nr:RNA-directed DNA polymerase, eukaryota [Tanacetum cinerariifolium]
TKGFKIIVYGKIFVLRAKELFVWSPVFNDDTDVEYCTDDESVKGNVGDEGSKVSNSKQVNLDAESDVEGVSETYFGEHDENLGNVQDQAQSVNDKEISNDPFNIHELLKKRNKGMEQSGLDTSIPYPPGFTPEKVSQNIDDQEMKSMDQVKSQSLSKGFSSCIMEDMLPIDEHLSSDGRVNGKEQKKGGSILGVLDDMIKVGQTMGFSME